MVDTSVDVTTTFTDNEIIITNTLGGMFAPGFTGPRYLFSGTTITNVTIDNASSSDFLGVLSFTANAIMINFAGISPAVGSTFILDVNSSPAAVPEPSTWALMALGFGVLGGAGYWTRRRSVSIAA